MSKGDNGLDPEAVARFRKAFEPLSGEEISKARADQEAALEADERLRAWATSERGMLALLVDTLAGCEPDDTIGGIKVYDDGGRCLGYLCSVVEQLVRTSGRTSTDATDGTDGK